jgi:hypothetical protein
MLLISSILLMPILQGVWQPSSLLIVTVLVFGGIGLTALRHLQPGDGVDEAAVTVVSAIGHPWGAIESIAAGNDSEMLDGIAAGMAIVPSQRPFEPGSALTTVLTHPIPRSLWPNKPRPADDILNDAIFQNNTRGTGNAQVAMSIVMNFYLDSGYLGVAVGMLFLGIVARAIASYRWRFPANDSVMRLYAMTLPMLIVLVRGSLPITLGRLLFTVAPLIVLPYFLRER